MMGSSYPMISSAVCPESYRCGSLGNESASWLECGLESSRHHRSRCEAPQRGTLIVAAGFQADTAAQRLREGRAHLIAFGRKFPICPSGGAPAARSTPTIQRPITAAARRDTPTILRWRRTAASGQKPASTNAGDERSRGCGDLCDQRAPVRLSDFFKFAALDSSACRSAPDISGSKDRTTPPRPTMLGSERVTPSFWL